MDNNYNGATLYFTERDSEAGRLIGEFDEFTAREMVMTPSKVAWLWDEMCKYRTLFSDLTRNDIHNFTALVTDANSLWIEVYAKDELVGVIYFTDMQLKIDCYVHLIFFDRKPREKAELCRIIGRWMFDNFPLNRISAIVPDIYYATVSLAKLIGFKKEGVKRQSQLMGNRWVNEVHLGLLRSEMQ